MSSQFVHSENKCLLLNWARAYGDTKKKLSSTDEKTTKIIIRSLAESDAVFELQTKQNSFDKFFSKLSNFIVNFFHGTHNYDLQFQIEKFQEESQKAISETDLNSFLQQKNIATGELLQNLHDLNSYIESIAKIKHLDSSTLRESASKAEELLKTRLLQEIHQKVAQKIDDSFKFKEIKQQALRSQGVQDELINNLMQTKTDLTPENQKNLLIKAKQQIQSAWDSKTSPTEVAKTIWQSIDESFITSEEFKDTFFNLIEQTAEVHIKKVVDKTDFRNISISVQFVDEKTDPALEITFTSNDKTQSLGTFIKELSNAITGPQVQRDEIIEKIITKAIQEKIKDNSGLIQENLKEELHTFYYQYSIPHIKCLDIPPQTDIFLSDNDHSQLLFDAYSTNTLEYYPTGVKQDCDFSGTTIEEQIKNASNKITDLRKNHLRCARAISVFFLKEGSIFLNIQDQQNIVDNINQIYTLRNEEYFAADKNIAHAGRCLDALNGIERFVQDVITGMPKQSKDISAQQAGSLIVLFEEQTKACEKILQSTKIELVQEKATKVKNLCKNTEQYLRKNIEQKLPQNSDGTKEGNIIHYHGNVTIQQHGAGNINLGVVYGDMFIENYVYEARKAQDKFLETCSPSDFLQNLLGTTIQGAATGLIFGGIPTMVTTGVLAATRVLVQPAIEYVIKKTGASDKTAELISFMAATAMTTYTSSYVSAYLSGKKIEDQTSSPTTTESSTTEPTLVQKISNFVSEMHVFEKMQQSFKETLPLWNTFIPLTNLGMDLPPSPQSTIKEYVFQKNKGL